MNAFQPPQQAFGTFADNGMNPAWRKLGNGLEHEDPLQDPGMGQDEARGCRPDEPMIVLVDWMLTRLQIKRALPPGTFPRWQSVDLLADATALKLRVK